MATPVPPSPPAAHRVRKKTAWLARLAALGLLLAVPVVTWWAIGPNPGNEYRNNPTVRADDWDYMFHPPVIDPTLEQVVVIAALVTLVVSIVVLAWATRSRRIDPRWWFPIGAMSGAGFTVAVAERVMTAAVSGANIGGGLMVLFGTPIVVVLVLGSLGMTIFFLHGTKVIDRA